MQRVMEGTGNRECRVIEGLKRRKGWCLIWTILVFLSQSGYAQQYPAYDAATTGASTGASGFGRFLGNPSCWSTHRTFNAGQYYQQSFLLRELATRGLGMTTPLGSGTLGSTYISEGFKLFRKSWLSAGYARFFGKKLAAGLAFDYLQLSIAEGYGSVSGPGTHIGVSFQLSSTLKAGTYMFFPIGNGKELKESFQPFSAWGLRWAASGTLDIVAEIAKEALNPAIVRAGMYYNDKKHLMLQGGINFLPASYYAGAGFITRQFTFIINSVYRSPLGFSPSITLLYEKR